MKVGILGAGGIATTMSCALNGLREQGKDIEAYAVASRSQEKADQFAKDWNVQKAYGSYEAMLADPEVDLVYVATPHSHHYEHTKLCIEYGKPALVEKAFTANAKQAEEVLRLAKEKGILVTEAIWTRYQPSRKIIDDTVASGIIGEPKFLRANLSYVIDHVERMVNPALAGGALLDLGVYPLNFASMVFGDDLETVTGFCSYAPTGVDAQEQFALLYKDGRMATLSASYCSNSNRMGVIQGTKGYIEVQNINNPEQIRVYDNEYHLLQTIDVPEQINGYEYEVLACQRALEGGELECEEMPHAETIRMMQIMDGLRAQWGIKYPFE